MVGVDCAPETSAACSIADQRVRVPRCSDPNFVSFMKDVCLLHEIDVLVPTIDTELEFYAVAREEFNKIGVRIAVSDPSIVRMARNKESTMKWLEEAGVPVPRSASMPDFLDGFEDWSWPVVLKPFDGSSSIGLHVVEDICAAKSLDLDPTNYLVQEYCRGSEYTVNLFFDQSGCLRTVIPHLRIETRAGEVSKGVTERMPELIAIGWDIGGRIKGARGVLCFQAIVGEDGPAVFEINARFGGGYPIAHHAGAEFSTWLLQEAAGVPSSANDEWREGVTMLRYDQSVFSG